MMQYDAALSKIDPGEARSDLLAQEEQKCYY